MSATRRAILTTGTAAVVLFGAGAAGWILTRAPRTARAPWAAAGSSFGDIRIDCLSYAILAPNPHNMQPWRIRLDTEDRVTVFCDAARLLPQTDPLNRQIVIGFGCFLELMRQAAANRGFRLDVETFPEGAGEPTLDDRPVAAIRFAPDENAAPDPLFAAAVFRRTNRAPFEARPVERAVFDRLLAAGVDGVVTGGVRDGQRRDELRALAKDAWEIEWALDRTRRESITVTRIGAAAIDAKPWGLALSGPLIEAASIAGALTTAAMDVPGTEAYRQSLEFYNKAIDTAQAFVWISTATNTRADQLNAGRAFVRMQQAATLDGVAVHPLSQALQEFPDMAPAYDRAHELMAHRQGATVQMLARLGYAPTPAPAPREALEAKLVPA